MGNPLIAETKDSTTAISGIPILESVNETSKAIESGDWAAGVLGAAGTALDALGMAMDPFGSILAAGVGWLIEHVGPLSDALDALTGNPDEIKAHSETWKNVGTELSSISADLAKMIEEDTASWTGPAGDAYRDRGADTATLISSAQSAAEGASSGIGTAGEVVGAVRSLVRDIIAELVGHLISWALQVLFTLGIGMAWVVPQVISAVAKTAMKIADITEKLVQALKKLAPLLKKLGDSFGDAAKKLKDIKGGKKPDTNTAKGDGTSASNAKGDNNNSGPPTPQPNRNDPPSENRGLDGGGSTSSSGTRGGGGNRSGGNNGNNGGNGNNGNGQPVGPDGRNCKGDPVDVATGEVIIEQVDLTLGDLVLRRTHVSSHRAGRWFGPSWSSTLDQRLEVGGEQIRYFSADGMVLVYPRVGEPAEPVAGPRWTLTPVGEGYTLTTTTETLHFSGSGRTLPLRAIDGALRTEVFYDDLGAPTLLQRADGVRVGLRTRDGRITDLRVLGGESKQDVTVLRYGYNERRHLADVINSSGRPQHFDYDAQGRVTGWQDRNGAWYRYVYDTEGRCVRTVGDGAYLDGSFTYDEGVTTYVDSLGHRTVIEYDDRRRTTAETDPLGGTTRFTWDEYDRLLSRTDPLGRTTNYEHDEQGRPTRVVRPDGSTALLGYTGAALTSVTVPGEDRIWHRHYDSGAPDPLTEPVGTSTGLPLDAADTAPAGVAADHDQFGRPRAIPEVGGGHILLGWTIEGQRASRTGTRQERASWRYDGEGNETEHTDELGRTTRREYGPFGLLTAVVDPAGGRTRYGYDTELRLTSVTDPEGRTWTYGYDPAGRLAEQTDFDGRTRTYRYDAAGQLTHATDAAGEVTEYRYDLLGNLVEVHGPDGVTSYAYDPVGEVVRISTAESTVEFERDGYGRVVRETVDGRTVTFSYEHNTIRRRTPSGVDSDWAFDDLDRPVALSTAGHVVRYRHDEGGRVVAREVDGVSVLRQSFGPGGRLTAQQLDAGQAPVQRRAFEYLADGKLAALQEDVGGRTALTRDAAARIVAISAAHGAEELRYDGAGNLVAWPGSTAISFDHDHFGRRVRRREAHPRGERVWHYEWTGERLTGLRTPEGDRWRYRYDPLGRRIAKQRLRPDGGIAETTSFVWDGATLIEQIRVADGVTESTTWNHLPGTATPVTQLDRGPAGERFHSVITDAVGTPTELVDEHGQLAWHSRRTLWGRELPSSAARASTPLRFPGQYADPESGLHYNVFRYYDPASARYLSQDPLGLTAGPNPFAYVGDPFGDSDVLGLVCTRSSDPDRAPTTPNSTHNPGNTGGSATPPGRPVPPGWKRPLQGPTAEELVNLGRHWNSQVWMKNGSKADTKAYLDSLPPHTKIGLDHHGIKLNHGFQQYDPVVRMDGHKLTSYQGFVDKVTAGPDGGKHAAADLNDWASGRKTFDQLPQHVKDMATITHFAEVGRGYSYDVAKFNDKMGDIAKMNPADAAAEWKKVNDWFPPSLTYKQDTTGTIGNFTP
ncbi:RHS repeat-associated core domain-containing protein [Amycolatopsis sp. 195334CR]|uniref:RHS repeat-associated core domain-containing protein n=1 Tax=Amycolatopsis sp. 195334CR TaxID=2814588 RepID=UPI001A902C78|nr:RHS repeat-associated core domain-containing protein [Amycolatopsis sp. 195334CR]MBN6040238.1 type IV secretion protein Rhs [Amycolatopsis sp. 195334CR]